MSLCFQICPDGIDPKLICEECASELILVAKFHEKCKSATETLCQLKETSETKYTITAATVDDDSLPDNVQIIGAQCEKIEQIYVNEPQLDDDNIVLTLGHNAVTAAAAAASPPPGAVKDEQIEYITDTGAFPEEDFDYVIIDENVVQLPVINRSQSIDEDSLIEEIDDNVTVITEYLHTDADELTDSGQGNLDDDDSGGGGGGSVSGAEIDAADAADDLDGVIRNQVNRAKRRKVEFGSAKASSRININYSCNLCGAGFAQFTNLTRHLETHTKMVPGEMLTCTTCKQTFNE